MTRAFVDTNVLVYAVDADEPRKRERALQLITDPAIRIVLSTQVLLEFYAVVTRKLAVPLAPQAAQSAVARLARNETVAADASLVTAAITTSIEARLSIWDAMIVEAARAADCEVILTEDLADGAVIRGVRVENPFRETPA